MGSGRFGGGSQTPWLVRGTTVRRRRPVRRSRSLRVSGIGVAPLHPSGVRETVPGAAPRRERRPARRSFDAGTRWRRVPWGWPWHEPVSGGALLLLASWRRMASTLSSMRTFLPTTTPPVSSAWL